MQISGALPYAAALLAAGAALAQPATMPHLEKRGDTTQLMVDGRPFLMLGGELTNSASSSLDYLAPYWPKLAAANLDRAGRGELGIDRAGARHVRFRAGGRIDSRGAAAHDHRLNRFFFHMNPLNLAFVPVLYFLFYQQVLLC